MFFICKTTAFWQWAYVYRLLRYSRNALRENIIMINTHFTRTSTISLRLVKNALNRGNYDTQLFPPCSRPEMQLRSVKDS